MRKLTGESKKVVKIKPKVHPPTDGFFSTGSTLLNLALSDDPYGGYAVGTLVNLIGDSSSGKSFLAWTLFAEMLRHKQFNDYRLVYDEPEAALRFSLEQLFGKKIGRVGLDITSDTVQDWSRNVWEVLKGAEPFVYILDSFDALTSDEELALQNEGKVGGKGGWKTEKASVTGELLRKVVRGIENTSSLVVVVSQVRDKLGVIFGPKKYRAGGRGLKFYSTHEMWLNIMGHIKKKERDIGVNVRAVISKNKVTGKLRQVEFPIIFDYGVDDLGSMIDWMIKEGFWKKPKGRQVIQTGGDFIDATKEKLITTIEERGEEGELVKLVGECWDQIEQEIATDRKPRYE